MGEERVKSDCETILLGDLEPDNGLRIGKPVRKN
jgi:hypothetical protein